MRIGIDGSLLYGDYSGVEYAIWNLLKALAEVDRDDEFVVYVPHDFRSDVEFPFNWRFVRLPFRGAQKLVRVLWQQLLLPRRMLRDRLNLFHAPAYVMPLRAPVPTVLTVYDAIAFTHPRFCTRANRLHYRRIMPPSLQKARCVIVPSQAIRRDLVNLLHVSVEKVHVIPLGVEDIFFVEQSAERLEAVREKYRLPEQFLLFVGNIEPKKNLRVLLDAMHALPLVIAGRWIRERTLERWNVGTSERFKVLGYVPREDLPALYALAAGLVYPSLYEGFGLPPLEAMACGTPVVVSTAGALPEVVGDAALLADPNDVQQWTACLQCITTDADLRERLRNAGRRRAGQFTWDRTARATGETWSMVNG